MLYKVIGLMSGSSLDGLDIAYVHLEEQGGNWSFQLLHSKCIAFPDQWKNDLTNAPQMAVGDFLNLHTKFGAYLGQCVAQFIEENQLNHKVDFLVSHGHTVYHNPAQKTSFQLGDGASIAAQINLPVINDLRATDIAFGGQGAPIVPIGDRLLFSAYTVLINLGGIANITLKNKDSYEAFDVAACNQVLNYLAQKLGKEFDDGGQLARQGHFSKELFDALNAISFFNQATPKSLSNLFSVNEIFPVLTAFDLSINDLLNTVTEHLAYQIKKAIPALPTDAKILVTGGGAFNTFLIERMQFYFGENAQIIVPDAAIVNYKEAIVMALIGTLRWREEVNVLKTVTGASKDSIGGCLWIV